MLPDLGATPRVGASPVAVLIPGGMAVDANVHSRQIRENCRMSVQRANPSACPCFTAIPDANLTRRLFGGILMHRPAVDLLTMPLHHHPDAHGHRGHPRNGRLRRRLRKKRSKGTEMNIANGT